MFCHDRRASNIFDSFYPCYYQLFVAVQISLVNIFYNVSLLLLVQRIYLCRASTTIKNKQRNKPKKMTKQSDTLQPLFQFVRLNRVCFELGELGGGGGGGMSNLLYTTGSRNC